jgi:ribosomal protein S18 acetylase RimI-like enzyme
MNAALKLRPVDPDDEPILRELRGQVDSERLGLQYWSPEQEQLARQIIDLQFRGHATHHSRLKANWDTKDCVIELDGAVVGRFIVTQGSREVYLAEITVHRDHRGKGIGQAVIDGIKGECIQSKRTLRLHVDPQNSALQFYLQLGFRVVEADPVRLLMEWVPPTAPGDPTYFSPRRG